MANVQFQKITKSFGALTVLDELNLEIEKGEFIVLLGPSGCGKSTLLNILAGLIEQSSGRITIGDQDVTDLDPADRNLAMVFQSYALYPTKSVRGNLKFGLMSKGLSNDEIDRRITSVANLLQIDKLLDRKPAQLSGGQRQRVAIGRALVKEVDVCLFDEPLSNLDAKLRTEMRMEIKNLHNRLRNTVVYVTHDQVEAMTMATRIAVMNRGVIEQIGTPDEIYGNPQSLFVAEFVGSPSMNFIDVAVTQQGSELVGVGEQLSQADEELLQSTMFNLSSGLHGTGTCRIGTNEDGVVDARLRVHGVEGLRVVDCSVMPTSISGNTNGPAMAVGRRAAELILEDVNSQSNKRVPQSLRVAANASPGA